MNQYEHKDHSLEHKSSSSLNKLATSATTHCMTGCGSAGIGYSHHFWMGNAASIAIAVVSFYIWLFADNDGGTGRLAFLD